MLATEGVKAYVTNHGEETVALAKVYDFDVALLYLTLPDISGYAVLRALRTAKVKTPVIVISDMCSVEDKVKAFGLGADDFVAKPFHKDELIARIHAVVRRSRGHAQSVITIGALTIDLDRKCAVINGCKARLTGKEYQMLELLALREGMTISKEMFLNQLYGGMNEPESKIIDFYICKLRQKLKAANPDSDYIATIWGLGYLLRETPARREAA
jgi:two-component system, cell cycle response regulator CtrA